DSAITTPAMTANLRVTKIEGPTVNGTMRGVRFIEIGMIQNVTYTQKHGDYDGFVPPKRQVSSLEGQSYLDCYTTAPWASTIPWYDSNAKMGTRSYYTNGTDPVAGAPVTNIDFNVTDFPSLAGTESIDLIIGGVTKSVDRFAIVFDCKLY